jgi:hypothetical protein
MPTSSTVKAEYTPGQQQFYPVVSSLAAPPIAPVYNAKPPQTSAVAIGTVNVTFPTGAVGSVVTASGTLALTPWPQVLSLAANQRGAAVASLALAAPVPQLLVGLPYLVLTFGSGTPLVTSGGTATFALQAGRTYATPTLSFTVRALITATYVNPLVVPFSVAAVLYGFQA